MAGIPTRFEVLPPLEEWHLNLEVGSQVYQLLEGFKKLRKATLWPDTTFLLHRGGFQNRVQESRFRLRTAASETEPPEVIAEHWLDNLRNDSILVECPPDQFTAPADWIPLYTSKSLQQYLPAALSAFPNQGVPSLSTSRGSAGSLPFVRIVELSMRTPTRPSAM